MQKILENYGALSRMTQEKQADFIEHDILPKMRNKVKLDDLLLALDVVSRQKNLSQMRTEKEIYFDEYNALRRGGKCEEEEFVAFETNIPTGFGNFFDKIVVVEKLIVIQALCGFTRLKPWSGETLDDKKIAPIFAGERDWLPAVKLSGEGIFIQLNQQKIDEWCERMGGRYDTFNTNYRKSYFRSAKFSTQYVMLHSFAHLFIRQLAHECGYSASSMRERIYSTFNGDESPKMCGVLVYLSTPDSEGSLGGLIGIPQNIAVMEKILTEMLEKALWCSADPLCINSTEQGLDSLNLSACHDCTLLPETSCEFRNILLDRAAIVGTPENRELGFFSSAIMTASISDRR